MAKLFRILYALHSIFGFASGLTFLGCKHKSSVRDLRMSINGDTSYKAPWWKVAVASLGILTTSIAVMPESSFAADTVKVIN